MRTIVHASVVVMVMVGLPACGKSPSQPTGAKETLAKLTIGGALNVTAIGQTFQLNATVTASNTATRDVTNESEWASLDTSVATVTSGGLVTIVGLGTSSISATYKSFAATKPVNALLPATAVTLTGSTTLDAVGATSQLRAIVRLLNGDTADATNYATWTTMTVPSVVRVTKGLVTADALGWGQINVTYGGRLQATQVIVTPPGTYIIRGFVKHPGHAGVSGFNVLDTQSGRTTVTSSTGPYSPGWYSLGGMAGSTRLTFDKAGFEPAELTVTGPAIDGGGEVRVQQIYRVTAGGTVQTTIAPHDVEYNVSPSGPCGNCRLIRLVSPSSGMLHLNLTWDLRTAAFSIWIEGQRFSSPPGGPLAVDVPVGAGELVLYVGKGAQDLDYVTMKLTTGLSTPASAAISTQSRTVIAGRRP